MSEYCQECEDEEAEYPDPRNAPLDTGSEVLCQGCYKTALEEQLDDLEDEIKEIRAELAKL